MNLVRVYTTVETLLTEEAGGVTESIKSRYLRGHENESGRSSCGYCKHESYLHLYKKQIRPHEMSRPMKMLENSMMLLFKALKAVGKKEVRKPLTNSGVPWEIIEINIV